MSITVCGLQSLPEWRQEGGHCLHCTNAAVGLKRGKWLAATSALVSRSSTLGLRCSRGQALGPVAQAGKQGATAAYPACHAITFAGWASDRINDRVTGSVASSSHRNTHTEACDVSGGQPVSQLWAQDF